MNRVHITFSRAAVALLVSLGATTPTLAATCSDVTFALRPLLGFDIEVNRVDYRDLDSADRNRRWVENVPTTPCHHAQTCRLPEQNLGSATRPRRNHELTDIRFEYRRVGGNWVWSSPGAVPSDKRCTNERTYGTFEING